MRPNKLIAFVLLIIVISSEAIHIKEERNLSQKTLEEKALGARSLTFSKENEDLLALLKDLYNREDFRFVLGGMLKLSEKVDFAYSVTIFPNEKGEWDWTYSPKGSREVNEAGKDITPDDLKAILAKFPGSTLSKIIFDTVEDVAIRFVNEIIEKLGKVVLIALCPQLSPVLVVWAILKQAGVRTYKSERASDTNLLFHIGYYFDMKNKYDGTTTLFSEITLNLTKLKNCLEKFQQKTNELARTSYETFVPQQLKGVLKNPASVESMFSRGLYKFTSDIEMSSLRKENKISPFQRDWLTFILKTKFGGWTVTDFDLLPANEDSKWVVDRLMSVFGKFTPAISKTNEKVGAALKEALELSKDWVLKIKKWEPFSIFWRRRANRRTILSANTRRKN